MTLLPNSLNIDSMFIHSPNSPQSIEFCYLFLTSPAFRKRSVDKQVDSTRRLRESLSNQIRAILNSDKTSKTKRDILAFPAGAKLPDKLVREDHVLGNDFAFVIEELVKSHSVVFAVQDFFVAPASLTTEARNVIVIQRKGRSGYYPVYAKDETGEALYVLPPTDPRVDLIRAFHVQKRSETPSPVNRPVSTTMNDDDQYNEENDDLPSGTEPVDRRFTRKTVVAQDDIEFEEFEEELLLNYNNDKAAVKFTDEEQIVYIQNLLVEAEDPNEKATGRILHTLIADSASAADPSRAQTESVLAMRPSTVVVTADKVLEDYDEYLDRFEDHKKRSTVLYVNSPYSSATPTAHPPLHARDAVRNAFTTTYDLWNAEEGDAVPPVDHEECTRMSKNALLEVHKKYNITSPGKRPSRADMCDELLRHNFLAEALRDRIMRTSALVAAAMNLLAELTDVPKKLTGTKADRSAALDYVLRRALPALADRMDLRSLLSRAELLKIAARHNLESTFDSNSIPTEELFDALSNANVLTLSRTAELRESRKRRACEEDDVRALIDLSMMSAADAIPASRRGLQLFRPLAQDDITSNGVYYEGDPTSATRVIFDLESYSNLLRNIRDFLPLECVLRYHTSLDEIVRATMTKTLEDDAILQIEIARERIVYFNLGDVADNAFFVYPEIYDGYRYFKGDLGRNIFFKSNVHSPEEIRRIVAPSLSEYTQLYAPVVRSVADLERVLARFDTDPLRMTVADQEAILPSIVVSPTPKSGNTKKRATGTDVRELVSRHHFLRFTDENISDTHKMVLLQRRDYLTLIAELCAKRLTKQSRSKLDSLVAPIPTAVGDDENAVRVDIPEDIDVRPESFEELQGYRDLLREALRRNNEIIVRQRRNDAVEYVEGVDDVVSAYSDFMRRVGEFFHTKHEKEFVREMRYTKPTKRMRGTEGSDASTAAAFVFMSTNPTAMHAPLPTDRTDIQSRGTDIQSTILAKLVVLTGAPVLEREMDYIVKQTTTVFLPNVRQLKLRQAGREGAPNESDMRVWSHYTQIIFYGAFLTIFTQYKLRTERQLFKRCRDRFSIRGFPLDSEPRENSFVKYVACVVFTVFGRQNSYFQSEKHCEAQITAYIKLVFQNNKIIKQLFDARAAEFRKTRAREEKANATGAATMLSFRPFYGAKVVTERIERDYTTTERALSDRGAYKTHRMNNADTETMLAKEDRLFQLMCDKGERGALPPVVSEFTRTRAFEPPSTGVAQNDPPMSEDEYDDRVSGMLEAMRRDLGINVERFVDTFVAQTNPVVARYTHLVRPNGLYKRLIGQYPERFGSHVARFARHAVGSPRARSPSLLQRVHDMLEALLRDLGALVDTDDVYTFMNVSVEAHLRGLFATFVSEMEHHLNHLVDTFEAQTVDMAALKNNREVLREQKKQEKMRRYDGLEDEHVFVLRELEKYTGAAYEAQGNNYDNGRDENDPDGDEAENEEVDDRAEDDDYDE